MRIFVFHQLHIISSIIQETVMSFIAQSVETERLFSLVSITWCLVAVDLDRSLQIDKLNQLRISDCKNHLKHVKMISINPVIH